MIRIILEAQLPQVLLTLRVYALYGRSVRVLISTVGCGTILLGVSVVRSTLDFFPLRPIF
jgi:hypothetical protein